VTNLVARPAVLTPAADGSGGTTTIGFTLGAPARVTAQVLDASDSPVATILDEQRAAGSNTFTWAGNELLDGRYRLAVTAAAGGRSITKAADLTVDRTLTGLTASLPAISPNGDGVNDTVTFSFTLTQNVPVRLDILQHGAVVATPFQGDLGIGPHTFGWDGAWNSALLADGPYLAMITVTDQLGDVQLPLPLAIDTVAPVLTLLDLRTLKFNLDEPATVTLLVNQTTRIVQAGPKGTFTVTFSGAVVQVTGQAQDAAGNLSAAVGG
jgi:flagellar hook assembly protein FlgD